MTERRLQLNELTRTSSPPTRTGFNATQGEALIAPNNNISLC